MPIVFDTRYHSAVDCCCVRCNANLEWFGCALLELVITVKTCKIKIDRTKYCLVCKEGLVLSVNYIKLIRQKYWL